MLSSCQACLHRQVTSLVAKTSWTEWTITSRPVYCHSCGPLSVFSACQAVRCLVLFPLCSFKSFHILLQPSPPSHDKVYSLDRNAPNSHFLLQNLKRLAPYGDGKQANVTNTGLRAPLAWQQGLLEPLKCDNECVQTTSNISSLSKYHWWDYVPDWASICLYKPCHVCLADWRDHS